MKDWYEHRNELEPGMVFITHAEEKVMLSSRVPGDGTKWYVEDWWDGWIDDNSTIEPGDLKTLIEEESPQ